MLPSGPVSVAKKPMTNEPVTFTNNVPHGKVSPSIRATTPVHKKRDAAEGAADRDQGK